MDGVTKRANFGRTEVGGGERKEEEEGGRGDGNAHKGGKEVECSHWA